MLLIKWKVEKVENKIKTRLCFVCFPPIIFVSVPFKTLFHLAIVLNVIIVIFYYAIPQFVVVMQ